MAVNIATLLCTTTKSNGKAVLSACLKIDESNAVLTESSIPARQPYLSKLASEMSPPSVTQSLTINCDLSLTAGVQMAVLRTHSDLQVELQNVGVPGAANKIFVSVVTLGFDSAQTDVRHYQVGVDEQELLPGCHRVVTSGVYLCFGPSAAKSFREWDRLISAQDALTRTPQVSKLRSAMK